MNCITTSVFDIFKVGPGPSSSHTIGPMRGANDFLSRLAAAVLPPEGRFHVVVHLFGSLALTGKGHGTDRAAAAGLLGEKPDTCDIILLENVLKNSHEYTLPCGDGRIYFAVSDIKFHTGKSDFPYSNTMQLQLLAADGTELLVETYYSVGGGFVLRAGAEEETQPELPYRYRDFASFERLVVKYGVAPLNILYANEAAISSRSEAEIRKGLESLVLKMLDAVDNGLRAKGLLPGAIRLERRAAALYAKAENAKYAEERAMLLIDAFSLAAAEENGAGHLVVTAPTSGSAGLLPGIIAFLHRERGIGLPDLADGLVWAGLFALVARHNASISGAEVGCQGEIGVASAMAAALLAGVSGGNLGRIGNAAEIALEHHLGLSCDPVDGYVQIPCIERNAVGAVTAWNAFLLAMAGDGESHKVTFDEVVAAMLNTGCRMSSDFKETGRGGLAICTLCC